MAKIVKYEFDPNGRIKEPSETACIYRVGHTASGRIAAFTTVGSTGRKYVGSVSQTIHFDKASAQEMVRILREIFDFE